MRYTKEHGLRSRNIIYQNPASRALLSERNTYSDPMHRTAPELMNNPGKFPDAPSPSPCHVRPKSEARIVTRKTCRGRHARVSADRSCVKAFGNVDGVHIVRGTLWRKRGRYFLFVCYYLEDWRFSARSLRGVVGGGSLALEAWWK
jgi:hypothetical protein